MKTNYMIIKIVFILGVISAIGCQSNEAEKKEINEVKPKMKAEIKNTPHSPFGYNAGINYESWTMGRTNMNIKNDLTYITNYFSLIKTFHFAAVGTTNIEIDPTQQQVIDFVTGYKGQTIQLIMGTNSSAIAQGGYGKPWQSGLMDSTGYTDLWVDMLINAFGSKEAVLKHLKCICLGNEVDANGPPSTDPNFVNYYTAWIPDAMGMLSTSLKNKGLGSIPVTTIIANYPLGDPSSNIVASSVTKYIYKNWSTQWNNNRPFVFFNQYTPDWGKSTDFNKVINYFTRVQTKLGDSCQVFVGETGYSAEYGLSNEDSVITDVFNWLSAQQGTNNGLNIPLNIFQAFDHSQKPVGQQQMGLFTISSSGQYGIKEGITIPAWVNKSLN